MLASILKIRTCTLVLVAAIGFTLGGAHAQQSASKRAITKIAGDLYRFQNNFHYSVFLVTPEGVIVTDPINADAATWLKKEIAARFNKPIKYLILSHDHVDHSGGGEVFADTAIVVAHANAKRTILGEKRPTAAPDITFSDRMDIELGGKRVELVYVGKSHSDNLIVMRFPEERTLFAVDVVTVDRLLYKTLSDAYFPEWIDALKKIESLDFDILAPGHGVLGTKSDVANHRSYVEDLYSAVLAGLRDGKSVADMQDSILLPKYKNWGQYEAWRPLNIQGMAASISLHRRGN